MWFDGIRQPNTLYVASVSRGKDSTAMLRAIQLMNWPLDAICSVDIWFDNDTPAELPPMVAFKDKWDEKCLDRFGVSVTRLCATKRECANKLTYTDIFYRKISPQRERERERELRKGRNSSGNFQILGYPQTRGAWCQSDLKRSALTVSRCREATGVQDSRREQSQAEAYNVRFPNEVQGTMVQQQTQGRCTGRGFRPCARTRRRK